MRKTKKEPKIPSQRSFVGIPAPAPEIANKASIKAAPNRLYYGDNLDILRKYIKEETIDLIYIDPPFNSKRNYNVLFESMDMKDTNAQKHAFADTWSNYDYVNTLNQLAELNKELYDVLSLFHKLKSISDSAVAYLSTMAIRIYYMHKALRSTGSFYLHCDPTMSHYIKLLCDMVFKEENFVNEIVWKRSDAHSDTKQGSKHYGRVHDVLLFYRKSDKSTFNTIYNPLPQSTIDNWYKHIEEGSGRRYNKGDMQAPGGAAKGNPFYKWNGHLKYWRYSKENMQKLHDAGKIIYSKSGMPYQKRYLDESKGISIQDWWDDISMLRGLQKGESLGYPTQKPEALLERIIKSSSNEGDVIGDFFCGCGTTIAVAQKLNRKWIGADISHLGIRLIVKRLIYSYGIDIKKSIKIHGMPKDIASAKELAQNEEGGRISFQDWAIEVMLNGVVNEKKVADGGYDGYLTFTSQSGKQFAIIETKSGNVNVKNMREFADVVNTQKAAMGIFVCFAEQVTKEMVKKAKDAGHIKIDEIVFPQDKIQIITIEDLFEGKQPQLPFNADNQTFKKAKRQESKSNQQKLQF
jgi:adenine specific DNA methylase Mod